MMTDPVGDLLTRIRNAGRAGHADATCPSSKLKLAVARVLKEEGYVVEEAPSRPHPAPVKRFERSRPGELWQVDLFTFTSSPFPIATWCSRSRRPCAA